MQIEGQQQVKTIINFRLLIGSDSAPSPFGRVEFSYSKWLESAICTVPNGVKPTIEIRTSSTANAFLNLKEIEFSGAFGIIGNWFSGQTGAREKSSHFERGRQGAL